MERIKMIILVLLLCGFYPPANLFVGLNSYAPCYALNKSVKIRVEHLSENKYSSEILFLKYGINISSMNGEFKPCNVYDPPLTNKTLKQIQVVLDFFHLTNEEISCDQINKLVHLEVNKFPFDYYYYPFGPIGKNVPAINQSLCEYNLEKLVIWESLTLTNKVIRNESLCEYRKLQTLTISFNKIWEIEEDAFICLEHLIEIDLSGNNLSSLPQRIFSRNQRLQTVMLSFNRFNTVGPLLSSLKPLPDLSFIDLSRNQIEVWPDVIPLRRLKRLNLCCNVLREIHRNAFSELVEVEDIDLSSNKLTEFHAETFRNNAKMKSLNLRYNALKNIPNIDNLSKLVLLRLDYNTITGTINLSNFFDNNINLQYLILRHNKIEEIIATSNSESLSNLWIDLSHNRIQSLINVILPNRVSKFDVRFNRIQTVCVLSLGFFPDSKVENVLRLSGNPLRCNCVHRELTFPYYRNLTRDFADLKCNISENEQVQLAGLEGECRIEFNSSDQCICYEMDHCSSNPLYGHCYALLDGVTPKITHICENLNEIPTRGYYTDVFRLCKHHLHFNGNNIEKLKLVHFDDDKLSTRCVLFHLEKSNVRMIENDAFYWMRNLEILSLRDNQIQVLPDNLFRNLTKLRELYLSNNRLTTLNGQTIAALNTVIQLELHNNFLIYLPIKNTKHLSHLSNLSLHDNPWSCECEFIQPFHDYLGNNTRILQRATEINCIDHKEYYNALQFDLTKCKHFLHLTAIVTSTTFAVVIITIAVLIFIYRREVRVLVYSRYRLRVFGPEVDDDVSSKQYDAFMAYNSKDEDFLINHLMPGLEEIQNPYRLCIHERDFPAGAFIQDSIIQAVQLSSRTIVLLSENFVESGWCRIEFKTAHAQMLQDRCPRVLLIVLGEIPRNLDPEMELYLRTNTYLRWGERLFWEKLYYAMPDQRVTAPATDIMPMYQL